LERKLPQGRERLPGSISGAQRFELKVNSFIVTPGKCNANSERDWLLMVTITLSKIGEREEYPNRRFQEDSEYREHLPL
jgi:hypothetical protein